MTQNLIAQLNTMAPFLILMLAVGTILIIVAYYNLRKIVGEC